MRNVMKSLVLAAVTSVGLSSAALAQDSVRIAYGDLDLSRPADAAVFKARTDAAVNAYCDANRGKFAGAPVVSARAACRREAHFQVRTSTPRAERLNLQVARARPAAVEVALR